MRGILRRNGAVPAGGVVVRRADPAEGSLYCRMTKRAWRGVF